jgi:hypothetical protein
VENWPIRVKLAVKGSSMQRPIKSAPNYTATCLVMGLINLLWIFFVIWAIWGLIAVSMVAVAINAWINRLARRREANY